jgi:hypothetical protein
MNNSIFPEISKQMAKRNEHLQDLTDLLGLTNISQVSRRLSGEVGWTIGDIEILCKHYNMDFWKLFKRKEN